VTPQETKAALIVSTALILLERRPGYSEQSPIGSEGDGHDWLPDDPWPDALDCSGTDVVCVRRAGFGAFSNGSANDQWLQHLGGIVHPSQILLPGDLGFFLGIENRPGYAGHTGVVESFNPITHSGLLLNAYDSAKGFCRIPFNRLQTTNETNGLGVVGFTRPANRAT
jgi:hypothetical protein